MNKKAKTKAQKADEDANLDEALDESFPASDTPSMTQPRMGADVTQRKPNRHPKGKAIHRGTRRSRASSPERSPSRLGAKTSATPVETKKKGTVETVTDLGADAGVQISGALRQLLADVFALYLKTKNFHWHMSGRHFRDYHLLLDEHATQIFAMTDIIAERARKIGGTTLRSISDISRHQRLKDNNAEVVASQDMLIDLRSDNKALTWNLRSTHEVCEQHHDVATASLIENWIDETERRTWFLSEIVG